MEIKKGMKLKIKSRRKGTYNAVALCDFNTETDEWYEVAVDQICVQGMGTVWLKGERVPCRRGLDEVLIRK